MIGWLLSLTQNLNFASGADETTGLHLVEACNGDVAMAIGMHMDAVGAAAAAISNVEPNANHDPPFSASSDSSQA